MATKRRHGRIDRSETFDEFLANDGILAEAEAAALKEIERDVERHTVIPGRERSERTGLHPISLTGT